MSRRMAGFVLTFAALVSAAPGCAHRQGMGLRGEGRVPYVVERPPIGDRPARRLHFSGYSGYNYGPAEILPPPPVGR